MEIGSAGFEHVAFGIPAERIPNRADLYLASVTAKCSTNRFREHEYRMTEESRNQEF